MQVLELVNLRRPALAGVLAAAVLLFARAGRADEPLVTPANASQSAGLPARLEITIVEVKFAKRRNLHFLSATKNFRASDNVPIAIRADDFEHFQKAGIADLAVHYLGHKIRVRGTVLEDEGQWMLVVSSPEQIELVDASSTAGKPAASEPPVLVITNEQGAKTELPLPLADLPRTKITVEHDGADETYEGVELSAVIQKAKVVVGADSRGRLLNRFLVIRAQDGYSCVFSLAEVDPYFANQPALLADRINGEPLPETREPLQLVVPQDKHHRRWVKQVIRIEVRNALDEPAAGKP